LSREEIETLMDEVTWFTAEEAVAAGLADTIGNEVKIAACFDLAKLNYAHVPEALKNHKPEKKSPCAEHPSAEDGMSLATAKAILKICETVSNEAPHHPAEVGH
ncbi:MAG: hypothetical protein IIA70_04140, partial [Proteobacteria bacterium]|nr:hypothetical protein [Pseudomonadota bacterium]